MAKIDEDIQQKILSDPRVQEAVKKAGQDALNDPQVQAMIVQTAKEKFPQVAAQAQAAALEWAKDPAVQAKAHYYAGKAGVYLSQAGDNVVGLVEQGPTGVRLLAFIVGAMSWGCAAMYFSNIGNFFNLPVLVVSGYQVIFSVTTIIFEAPPSVIEKIPAITKYQDILIDKAKFISEVLGRGFFYVFMGSLWLAFANLGKMLDIITGLCLIFVGVLHVAMHFGKLGAVASKMRGGYESLATNPPP